MKTNLKEIFKCDNWQITKIVNSFNGNVVIHARSMKYNQNGVYFRQQATEEYVNKLCMLYKRMPLFELILTLKKTK